MTPTKNTGLISQLATSRVMPDAVGCETTITALGDGNVVSCGELPRSLMGIFPRAVTEPGGMSYASSTPGIFGAPKTERHKDNGAHSQQVQVHALGT